MVFLQQEHTECFYRKHSNHENILTMRSGHFTRHEKHDFPDNGKEEK